ncbi:benzoate-CoA ligase family protein [Mycobacterium sp. OAE908]|uniref:benzoate-CoA ligase family protein n=1 Tax=Mycobacterium sp. OAE908 TaxID=2817899 RepID=UPI0034E1F260
MRTPSPHTVFNAADYLVDRHLREGRGSRTAVITSQVTLTYRDLADTVHRVAGGLQRLGVRAEERVVLCMADDVELLTAILAAMYLGAVPVPVSTMLTGNELGKLLADSRAKVFCASTEFAAEASAAVASAPEVSDVVFDAAPPVDLPAGVAVHEWDVLTSAEPITTAYGTWGDSPALWLYTSGTTGTPKAAMHRHYNIRSVAENYGAGVLAIRPQDRCLSVAKLFFAYGIGNSCFLPLSVGATTILRRERPTPAGIADCIRTTRPTLFFAVPTFYSSMLASDLPDDTFSGVRLGISAGEALPAVLYQSMRARFGIDVLDGIGSTEALHIFLSNRPGQVTPGSSGVPVPGYDVQLRDDEGVVIESPEQPGILYLKGASIATGYWCRADTTRQVFQGDWLRTGDAYVRNRDGSYSCLGRSGDMLKAGGIWVSPAEVEERLLRHPDVAEAAVVGALDPAGLEKPVACVVAQRDGAIDADALIAWCREELAAFKRPRAVVLMQELPKTATGKIRRNILREQVANVFDDAQISV